MRLCWLLLGWACSGPQRPAAAPDAPNVLLISLDTLRSDHLSFYGYGRNTAPFMDQIAADGAVFEQALSQSPETTGSHASLFTGRYPSEHGMDRQNTQLSPDEQTLAEQLQLAGYRTFAGASSVKFVPETGWPQGFEDWELFATGGKLRRSEDLNARFEAQVADPDPAPWFGFLHYFDVHASYNAPAEYRKDWLPGEVPAELRKTVDFIQEHKLLPHKVDAEQRTQLKGLYDGQIRLVDQHMERVWAALATPANGRPTLVMLTSDHGEAFFEHGYLGHGVRLHEEILRVPWVVWWPGKVAPGLRLRQPAQTVDVYPTVLGLLGLPIPAGRSGVNFGPELLGQSAVDHSGRALVNQGVQYWSIRRQRDGQMFKLVVELKSQSTRLERLGDDPLGLRDVQAQHPALVAELLAELQGYAEVGRRGKALRRTNIPAEETEALRAIGYVDEE